MQEDGRVPHNGLRLEKMNVLVHADVVKELLARSFNRRSCFGAPLKDPPFKGRSF